MCVEYVAAPGPAAPGSPAALGSHTRGWQQEVAFLANQLHASTLQGSRPAQTNMEVSNFPNINLVPPLLRESLTCCRDM